MNTFRLVNGLRPIHPGEILREDFLLPLGMSVRSLARALLVSAGRLDGVVNRRRRVTADIAARLARHFGGDAKSWMALQADYDLKTLPTREEIERRVQRRA